METNSVIEVKTSLGVKFVKVADIVYIKTAGKHSIVTTIIKPAFEAFHPIGWFERHLSQTVFCRCHKSYIINCSLIECLNHTSRVIIINNCNETLPFGRKYRQHLHDKINRVIAVFAKEVS